MGNNGHGFWRSFTAKRWGLNTLYCFLFLLFLDFVRIYLFKVNFEEELFSTKNLLAILLSSVLIGFLTTLWSKKSGRVRLFGSNKDKRKA